MIELTSVQKKFILHWGEMGTRWGINRTVAQIHALLYLSPEPLNADDITATLSVARSNVSTSLKELHSWSLVKTVQKLGDRKDHFETLDDPWEMFRIVANERKRREMDPTLALLNECLAEQKGARKADPVTEKRLMDMKDFFDSVTGCYDRMNKLPTSALRKLSRMGDRLLKLLPV